MKNLKKKDFDKTINYIRRKDISKTNNLLEGFFKITFLKNTNEDSEHNCSKN